MTHYILKNTYRAAMLLLVLTSSFVIAQESRPAKRPPVTFVPRLMGYFAGESLPTFSILAPDGTKSEFSTPPGRHAILAFLGNLDAERDRPVLSQLELMSKRYAEYQVDVVAIACWSTPDEFKSSAKGLVDHLPFRVFGDAATPYAGPSDDQDLRSAHRKTTLLGKLFGNGMSPAMPTYCVVGPDRKVLGQFFVNAQRPDIQRDGLGNLLLHAGIKLKPEDMPTTVAPESAFAKPAPRPVEDRVTLLAVGKTAPDFDMVTSDGKPAKLSDYKGKVIVLDFWATWCGPCKAALPHVNEVASKYHDQDVVVIASCTSDDLDEYKQFIADEGPKYPNVVFLYDPKGRAPERAARLLYGVSGIPQQFIIGKDGLIAASVDGYIKGEVLLDAALAKAGVNVEDSIIQQAKMDLQRREERSSSRPAAQPAKKIGS